MSHLAQLTLNRAVVAIADGGLTAVEYAEWFLQKADYSKHLNAFLSIEADAVLAAARDVDRRRLAGEPLGPLAGIPIAVKDNIESKGFPTTAGTPLLETYRPQENAAVLEKLLSAGAILLGKTNMHELAYGITNNNPFRGAACNPYDPERIAGGSSGGSAVAVASGAVPCALGTDTGGSVRIPAALCGIVGFRPSKGLWSQNGVIPISSTRDTIGPMANRVDDVVLLHQVVTGQRRVSSKRINELQLGVPRAPFWQDLDPEMESLCETALDKLRSAGARLIEMDVPKLMPLADQAAFPVALYETAIELPKFLKSRGIEADIESFARSGAGYDIRSIFEDIGSNFSSLQAEYSIAIEQSIPKLSELYTKLFRDFQVDGLVFPTTPAPAPRIGDDDTFVLNGRSVPTFSTFVRNTGPNTLVGLPSISLPVGKTASGLPVGLEIDAPFNEDVLLLAVAEVIEGAVT